MIPLPSHGERGYHMPGHHLTFVRILYQLKLFDSPKKKNEEEKTHLKLNILSDNVCVWGVRVTITDYFLVLI